MHGILLLRLALFISHSNPCPIRRGRERERKSGRTPGKSAISDLFTGQLEVNAIHAPIIEGHTTTSNDSIGGAIGTFARHITFAPSTFPLTLEPLHSQKRERERERAEERLAKVPFPTCLLVSSRLTQLMRPSKGCHSLRVLVKEQPSFRSNLVQYDSQTEP